MNKSKNAGFTLIELMIVVAIIGILAAIAVIQYQDYVSRSQLSRAVGELSGYKSAIEEFLMRGKVDFTADDIGYIKSNLTTDVVISDQVSVAGSVSSAADFSGTGSGALMVEIDNLGANQGAANLAGTIVNLSRGSDGIWACFIDSTTPSAAGGWKDSYLPSGCD